MSKHCKNLAIFIALIVSIQSGVAWASETTSTTITAPIWVQTLSALMVPMVAVIGLLIAWNQWKTNRNRLRHELFERRYKVFDEIMAFIAQIISKGDVRPEELLTFAREVRHARFIFDIFIDMQISQIKDQATEVGQINDELASLPVGEERTALIKERREAINWLEDQLDLLPIFLEDDLRLRH